MYEVLTVRRLFFSFFFFLLKYGSSLALQLWSEMIEKHLSLFLIPSSNPIYHVVKFKSFSKHLSSRFQAWAIARQIGPFLQSLQSANPNCSTSFHKPMITFFKKKNDISHCVSHPPSAHIFLGRRFSLLRVIQFRSLHMTQAQPSTQTRETNTSFRFQGLTIARSSIHQR